MAIKEKKERVGVEWDGQFIYIKLNCAPAALKIDLKDSSTVTDALGALTDYKMRGKINEGQWTSVYRKVDKFNQEYQEEKAKQDEENEDDSDSKD